MAFRKSLIKFSIRQVGTLFAVAALTFIGLLFASELFNLSKQYFDPNRQVINIVIENHKIIQPEQPIRVQKGKKVLLKIDYDVSEQFHIEGYHAFSKIKPDQTTELSFEALSPGSFPIFLDQSKKF